MDQACIQHPKKKSMYPTHDNLFIKPYMDHVQRRGHFRKEGSKVFIFYFVIFLFFFYKQGI